MGSDMPEPSDDIVRTQRIRSHLSVVSRNQHAATPAALPLANCTTSATHMSQADHSTRYTPIITTRNAPMCAVAHVSHLLLLAASATSDHRHHRHKLQAIHE